MTNFADLTFFGHNHPASFIVIHDHFILATLLLLSTNFSIVKIVNHHRNHRCYLSQEIQEVEPPNGRREDGPHGIQTTHVPPRSEPQKIIHNLKHPEMGNVNDQTIMRLSKTMIMATAKIITT